MAQPAARLADPVAHTSALRGLIAGALIGGGIALLTVSTGGLAGVALIGGATVLGASAGELWGSLSSNTHVAGQIAPRCSPDVLVNGRAAARAHLDFVDFDEHSGRPPIAQGSDSVLINRWPAARLGDRAGCDAVIADGSGDVLIGGGTKDTDEISPEVPGWVHGAMLAVGIASAVVLAGPVAAAAGYVGSKVLGGIASDVSGRVYGEGSDQQKVIGYLGAFVGGLGAGKGGEWFDRNYEVKSVGLGANLGNMRVVPRTPVKPLDVGTFGSQAARSVRDGLTPDHIPSFAAVRASEEAQLGRPLTPTEAATLRHNTNTVMIDTDIHQQVSRTYGGRNTPAQIATDSQDLGAAAARDQATYNDALRARGYSQDDIDAAWSKVDAANKKDGRY